MLFIWLLIIIVIFCIYKFISFVLEDFDSIVGKTIGSILGFFIGGVVGLLIFGFIYLGCLKYIADKGEGQREYYISELYDDAGDYYYMYSDSVSMRMVEIEDCVVIEGGESDSIKVIEKFEYIKDTDYWVDYKFITGNVVVLGDNNIKEVKK